MNDDVRSFYWIVLGVRAYRAMRQGRYATAAKLIQAGLKNGIFDPDDKFGSSWRTSILMNYTLTYRSGNHWIKGDI